MEAIDCLRKKQLVISLPVRLCSEVLEGPEHEYQLRPWTILTCLIPPKTLKNIRRFKFEVLSISDLHDACPCKALDEEEERCSAMLWFHLFVDLYDNVWVSNTVEELCFQFGSTEYLVKGQNVGKLVRAVLLCLL